MADGKKIANRKKASGKNEKSNNNMMSNSNHLRANHIGTIWLDKLLMLFKTTCHPGESAPGPSFISEHVSLGISQKKTVRRDGEGACLSCFFPSVFFSAAIFFILPPKVIIDLQFFVFQIDFCFDIYPRYIIY